MHTCRVSILPHMLSNYYHNHTKKAKQKILVVNYQYYENKLFSKRNFVRENSWTKRGKLMIENKFFLAHTCGKCPFYLILKFSMLFGRKLLCVLKLCTSIWENLLLLQVKNLLFSANNLFPKWFFVCVVVVNSKLWMCKICTMHMCTITTTSLPPGTTTSHHPPVFFRSRHTV